MNRLKKNRLMIVLYAVAGIVSALLLFVVIFTHTPAFGRLPRGERLERIRRSPNFREGAFRNLSPVPMLTSDKGFAANMLGFLFRDRSGVTPDVPMTVVRTDLDALDRSRDLLVWFGHSSYLLQQAGRRILVDPVFCTAAPLPFLNRPFTGADLYRPGDMPDVDLLVITHDHWDHLDYRTVTALKDRIGKVICPLGVGAHFERWGFATDRIVETDWGDSVAAGEGITVHCLPAQHFSGRGLRRNRTLWASFLIETPDRKTYLAGDGGYGAHFAAIGRRFPQIDLAVMENGQYSADWNRIHLMPHEMTQAVRDLDARRVFTVHHSKYALSTHPWDEPLRNEDRMRADSVDVTTTQIGEVLFLD